MNEKLLLNADCQLFIENYTEGDIVHNGNKIEIKKSEVGSYYCDLKTDGLYELVVEGESKPRASVFSICKLRNCLLEKERDYINHFLGNCKGFSDCDLNSNSTIADFLLVSIFVLEQLICEGNYDDAKTILDNIANSNCGICSEESLKINDCNCGKNNRNVKK